MTAIGPNEVSSRWPRSLVALMAAGEQDVRKINTQDRRFENLCMYVSQRSL